MRSSHGRSLRVVIAATAIVLAAWSLGGGAQQPAQGTSSNGDGSVPIEVLEVRDDVFLLVGTGGNTTVQVGPQGVLVVDTMVESMADKLVAAITSLAAGKPIRYVLNTHAHSDHTGGNQKVADAGSQLVAGNFLAQLGQQGAQSAFIVAHENVLLTLSRPAPGAAAVPFAALPTDTFFQSQKDMYFNGQAVQLIHVPHAHTDGDSLVFFRKSDVISTGDVYVNDSYPRVDLEHGHVNGVIEALNTLVDLMVSEQFTEGGTIAVPGHGRLADEIDVVEYRDMVTIVRDRIQDSITKGMTLAQVQQSRPTFDFDRRFGSAAGPWTTAMFVEAVYRNLSVSAGGGR